ncbi:hypothetical protein [Savagea faecisuis]|uniref:Uncharacterized protein n=1 Tax=Savagea faecisuis TaxID=1274803 RepID=A0ABW3GX42_9BACL
MKKAVAVISLAMLLTACSGASSEEGLQAIEQGDWKTASEQLKGEEAEWAKELKKIEEQSPEQAVAALQALRDKMSEADDSVQAAFETQMKKIEEQKQSLHAAWSNIDALIAEGAYEEAASVLESIRGDVAKGEEAKVAQYEQQLEEAMKEDPLYSNADGTMRIADVAFGDSFESIQQKYPHVVKTADGGMSAGYETFPMYQVTFDEGVLTFESDGDKAYGIAFESPMKEELLERFIASHNGAIYVDEYPGGATYNFVNPGNEHIMQVAVRGTILHASLILDDPNAKHHLSNMKKYRD